MMAQCNVQRLCIGDISRGQEETQRATAGRTAKPAGEQFAGSLQAASPGLPSCPHACCASFRGRSTTGNEVCGFGGPL